MKINEHVESSNFKNSNDDWNFTTSESQSTDNILKINEKDNVLTADRIVSGNTFQNIDEIKDDNGILTADVSSAGDASGLKELDNNIVNDNLKAKNDNLKLGNEINDVLSMDNSIDLLSATSVDNFADLKMVLSGFGGIIDIQSDIDFDESITISASFTINGNGYKFDGNSHTNFFNIKSGDLTFNNINFINGYVAGGGGFFSSAKGGAICVEKGGLSDNPKLIINSCNFTNNQCVGDGGGAIYSNSPLEINNSMFYKNSAGRSTSGGAIYTSMGGEH